MIVFENIASESGPLVLRHAASGVLLHSGVDPLAEAESVAVALAQQQVQRVLCIGHGLGYVPQALKAVGIACHSVEVFPELIDAESGNTGTRCDAFAKSDHDLKSIVAGMPPQTRIIILPYVLSLRDKLPQSLADYISFIHVTQQSQQLYRDLINRNIVVNGDELESMKPLSFKKCKSNKIGVALGAGPTLSAAISTLTERRSELCLVAASGAVPALSKHGINADWIVAMEARETTERDLETAADGSKVIFFPWTDPAALRQKRLDRYLAVEELGLETSGGSTGLAAADFCSKITRGALFMIGMDMSDKSGEYAQGSQRESANINLRVPKFNFMRSAASQWATRNGERFLYHMVMPGDDEVRGFKRLYPVEFETELSREQGRRSLVIETANDFI
ncbi:MAG: DUF115 domain-containing protein [Calditrichaeota bacterium]|nr:DUF115 domain-containing protein [Calditrichota bacterium]MCB9368787.1 DUF115 domain-containing protein [Calditrichota bacterium]